MQARISPASSKTQRAIGRGGSCKGRAGGAMVFPRPSVDTKGLGSNRVPEGPSRECLDHLTTQHCHALISPERRPVCRERASEPFCVTLPSTVRALMPTCLVFAALLPNSPGDAVPGPGLWARVEERTISEEGQDIPWEQRAEETEPPLQKVGCVATSAPSTCARSARNCRPWLRDPPHPQEEPHVGFTRHLCAPEKRALV